MTDTTPPPPGLRAQIAATIAAVRRLVGAHVALAKTEIGEIVDEVKKMVALIGAAIGLLVMTGMLATVGLMLFLGEWLFGSIGWGVLLGSLFFIDVAVALVLAALGVGTARTLAPIGIAVAATVVVALVLALPLNVAGQVAAALGVLVGLIAWPIAAGIGVARGGIDGEALKARFIPDQTIATTKETIEWVRERTPLGPKS